MLIHSPLLCLPDCFEVHFRYSSGRGLLLIKPPPKSWLHMHSVFLWHPYQLFHTTVQGSSLSCSLIHCCSPSTDILYVYLLYLLNEWLILLIVKNMSDVSAIGSSKTTKNQNHLTSKKIQPEDVTLHVYLL